MSLFADVTSGGRKAINLPNEERKTPIKFTVDGKPSIEAQREFIGGKPVGPVKKYKNGNIMDQWKIPVKDENGEERVVFVDKMALKKEIGRAALEAGVEGFAHGDEYVIEFTGKVRNDGGFMANTYKVTLTPHGGEVYTPTNNVESSALQAQEQAANAYQQTQQAPPAPQQGYAQQPPMPPQQGYPQAPPAPQGYPAQPPMPQHNDPSPW